MQTVLCNTLIHCLEDDLYPPVQGHQMPLQQDRVDGVRGHYIPHQVAQVLGTLVKAEQFLQGGIAEEAALIDWSQDR